MMDDKFLNELRRDPRPEFARDLRQKLARDERARDDERDAERPGWALLRPALAMAAAIALVATLTLSPAMRASAQAFLDLFRVRNFTAVTYNADRMKQLDGKVDLKAMLSDRVEHVVEPGAPRMFADVAGASQASGLGLRVPGMLPGRLALDSVMVCGEQTARLTVDLARLQQVLDALDLRDVRVPRELDGQQVVFHQSVMVGQRYRHDRAHVDFIQSKSPEVSLPPGTDLPRLGEIGLRILGLSSAEASRLAHQIDWRTTLLVPVPADAGSFREVSVQGHQALMVTHTRRDSATGEGGRAGVVVLWSDGDMVYALAGNIDSLDLLQMANSIQ